MTIENLVYEVGSKENYKPFLSRELIFEASNLQGGLAWFWPTHLVTLSMFDHNFRVPTYEVLSHTSAAKCVSRNEWPSPLTISVLLYQDRYIRRAKMAGVFREWLFPHPIFALLIKGPSARHNVHETNPFIFPVRINYCV